ncbi:MAG: hypothetical protein KatS3mg104_1189 [Phycisphaerae bacterium]|jgi:hypothetical protein|nr:MAG: hypothetical protein KatS3mg104_1189 [Phycisphaerae bacterium]
MAHSPVPSSEDRRTIVCLYCDKAQEVSRRAMQITCKYCYKSLRVEDVLIKAYEARRVIDTCGMVVVEKRGHVVADRIRCSGLIVRGKVKAHVDSKGAVLVGPEADLIGDVTAPSLAVGAGAVLNGFYRINSPVETSSTTNPSI